MKYFILAGFVASGSLVATVGYAKGLNECAKIMGVEFSYSKYRKEMEFKQTVEWAQNAVRVGSRPVFERKRRLGQDPIHAPTNFRELRDFSGHLSRAEIAEMASVNDGLLGKLAKGVNVDVLDYDGKPVSIRIMSDFEDIPRSKANALTVAKDRGGFKAAPVGVTVRLVYRGPFLNRTSEIPNETRGDFSGHFVRSEVVRQVVDQSAPELSPITRQPVTTWNGEPAPTLSHRAMVDIVRKTQLGILDIESAALEMARRPGSYGLSDKEAQLLYFIVEDKLGDMLRDGRARLIHDGNNSVTGLYLSEGI